MKLFILFSLVAVSQQKIEDESIEILSLDQRENEKLPIHNLKRPLKIHRLGKNEKREIYHYEQTFVIRDASLDDKVRRCELIEVYEKDEAEKVAKVLRKVLKKSVLKVDMYKMMYLLSDCDSVDSLSETDSYSNDIFTWDWNIPSYSFSKGIYPGTKWCGFGDAASSYHDLAEHRNVDRCCRAHDYCPIKVLSYDRRYNLTNVAVHSKSHCICDEAFYKCLTEENSWTASFLGHVYFYAASPECISGLPDNLESKMQFVPATRSWYK